MKQHFIHDLAMCKYHNIPCNNVSRTSKKGREYGVNYFIVEMNVSLLYIIVHQYIFIGIIICSPWKLFAVNTSSAQGLVLCLKLEQNKKREKKSDWKYTVV